MGAHQSVRKASIEVQDLPFEALSYGVRADALNTSPAQGRERLLQENRVQRVLELFEIAQVAGHTFRNQTQEKYSCRLNSELDWLDRGK